jgi:hypothetical protein
VPSWLPQSIALVGPIGSAKRLFLFGAPLTLLSGTFVKTQQQKRALPLIRAYNPAMQHSKLVVVQSYGSRPEADLAKGALEDAGIQAMVQADTAGGMREHLAWSGAGFKILVREEDATVARDVLTQPVGGDENPDADFQTDRDTRPPWRRFT